MRYRRAAAASTCWPAQALRRWPLPTPTHTILAGGWWERAQCNNPTRAADAGRSSTRAQATQHAVERRAAAHANLGGACNRALIQHRLGKFFAVRHQLILIGHRLLGCRRGGAAAGGQAGLSSTGTGGNSGGSSAWRRLAARAGTAPHGSPTTAAEWHPPEGRSSAAFIQASSRCSWALRTCGHSRAQRAQRGRVSSSGCCALQATPPCSKQRLGAAPQRRQAGRQARRAQRTSCHRSTPRYALG